MTHPKATGLSVWSPEMRRFFQRAESPDHASVLSTLESAGRKLRCPLGGRQTKHLCCSSWTRGHRKAGPDCGEASSTRPSSPLPASSLKDPQVVERWQIAH